MYRLLNDLYSSSVNTWLKKKLWKSIQLLSKVFLTILTEKWISLANSIMFHLFRMKKRTYNCWTIFQSFVQSEAPKVRKIEGFFFQFLFPLWLYLSIYKQGLYIRGHLRLDLKMPKDFQKSLKMIRLPLLLIIISNHFCVQLTFWETVAQCLASYFRDPGKFSMFFFCSFSD